MNLKCFVQVHIETFSN